MKRERNLVRKKQLYTMEFECLCAAASIIHDLFNWSENEDNISHFSYMENDLMNLLQELKTNNMEFVEKVPIKGGKENNDGT